MALDEPTPRPVLVWDRDEQRQPVPWQDDPAGPKRWDKPADPNPDTDPKDAA